MFVSDLEGINTLPVVCYGVMQTLCDLLNKFYGFLTFHLLYIMILATNKMDRHDLSKIAYHKCLPKED